MFEEEKHVNNKVFIVLGAIALIAAITGVAYAAYSWTFNGSLTNTISTGNVSMSFLESTDTISINNALPIDDISAKLMSNEGEKFDFAVTTTASGAPGTILYDINIEKVAVDTGYTALSDNQVKVYLTSITGTNQLTETQVVAPTLVSNIITSGNSGTLKASVSKDHSTANQTYTDKYRLRMWISDEVDAANWDINTKLQYKLKVSASGRVS